MDESGVFTICDMFGLASGQVYGEESEWGAHLSISCPLAVKKHNDAHDLNCSCSVSISAEEPSLARCWSFFCGYKGSFFNMLKQATEMRGNPPALIELLNKIEKTEKFTLDSRLRRHQQTLERKLEAHSRPPDKEKDVIPEARFMRFANSVPRYAVDRGITLETCKYWGLGHDKGKHRLVFPIRRYDGKLVGITGRVIPSELARQERLGNRIPKYHNYSGLDKTKFLFGEHLLKEKEPVIVCEGPIDAVITWQHLGIPTVASLGEGFSKHHAMIIASMMPPHVYLFLDNDPPGRMAAEKIFYQLRDRVTCKLMMPPEGMDPGELVKEEAQAALDNAITIMDKIRWREIDQAND